MIVQGGSVMLNTEDIRNKEVINIYDGKSMGFVCDIEINLKEGRIDGIVLPGDRGSGQNTRLRRPRGNDHGRHGGACKRTEELL